MEDFSVALADVASGYPALEPPNRMRVSEGAAKILRIKRPGGGSGPWSAAETPYMVKPMDTLASRRHSAVCFCGPAQTGKTVALIDAWMAHAVVNDPGDMAIFQMTQDKAREFSKQRIDRAIRNSPLMYAMRSAQARDDNLHDKQFKNGMWVRLAWPTATNMASTSYRYVAGTDYDRWPDDIDGEGDGFTQMGKRTTTFLSRGMVAVESSPGRPITDPSYRLTTPHEAPPVGGILGIYNTSDRQRLYWKCPHCADWFQATPGLSLFGLPSDDELLEDIRGLDIDTFSRQYARVPCPHCGVIITPAQREGLNARATWLEEGLQIDHLDRISGNPRVSSVAGFWLGGVAATYVSWRSLIEKQLLALLDYSLSGEELKLQSTANTDQGVPYMSRLLAEAAASNKRQPVRKAMTRYVVPDWTRFVVSAVDVQGGANARFVVQTHAVGEHQEQALVDRREIKWSRRPGQGEEFAPLDPARYPEDWDILTDEVVQATYRTSVEDQEIRTRMTFVDSGGEAGVTTAAYAWFRRLRQAGLHRRARVTKGHNQRAEWHIRETMVGGEQGKGDIPLLLLEPNKFKDVVDANLKRLEPGPGFYHFPPVKGPAYPDSWVTQAFFDELRAEVRGENGVWSQIKTRNETFDLCYMIRAACMHLGADKRTFWANPPAWARPLTAGNSELVLAEVRRAEQAVAAQTAPTPAAVRASVRRVRRSSYLS